MIAHRLDDVVHYLESDMAAEEPLPYGFDHIAVATGSVWRRDGVGRWHTRSNTTPIGGLPPSDPTMSWPAPTPKAAE